LGALKGLQPSNEGSFSEAQYECHNGEEQVRWNHGGEMHEASWSFEQWVAACIRVRNQVILAVHTVTK
jgi:hypothetical protein